MTIITHHGDGHLTALSTGEVPLQKLGLVQRRRLSHIWPAGVLRRRAFCLLRIVFGDRGRVASWTRRWRGPWQVRLAETPRVIAFTAATRSECVAWEISHFTTNPP